ncbi:uncharacterized protein LOC143851357 isoform X3 [Tasmannia lanceolata]|uniref:uncharacterized protein LOC143851357 isoform X3 n=1 Tax=Tasmannia lanceolata TaxID=3420 RepID=UPI00406393E5
MACSLASNPSNKGIEKVLVEFLIIVNFCIQGFYSGLVIWGFAFRWDLSNALSYSNSNQQEETRSGYLRLRGDRYWKNMMPIPALDSANPKGPLEEGESCDDEVEEESISLFHR